LVQTPSRQRLDDVGIELAQVHRVLAVVHAVARHQLGGLIGRADMGQRALQQHRRAVADHAPHQRWVDPRQLELGEQGIDGGGDVRRAVDQGAVQVEDQGVATRCPSHHFAVFKTLIQRVFRMDWNPAGDMAFSASDLQSALRRGGRSIRRPV